MIARTLLAACFLALPAATGVCAQKQDERQEQQEQAAPPPTIEELDAKAATITSLKANFQREKHSDLLLEPLLSSGRITVKEGEAGGVRWDTLEPRPSTVIIARGKIIAREGQGAAEQHDIPESLARLTASPRLELGVLQDAFTIEIARGPSADAPAEAPDDEKPEDGDTEPRPAPQQPDDKAPAQRETAPERILLTLAPIDEDLQRFVDWVRIELDPDTAAARRIEYADPDGERTILRFTDIQINPEVSESLFKPDNLR